MAALARFLCFQGFAVLTADLADEAVADVDPHHGLSVDDFLLMHDNFLDQRVKEFFGQLGGVSVLFDQGSEFFGIMALPGITDKYSLNLIVDVTLRINEKLSQAFMAG